MSAIRVGVIGGGVGGLSAAIALAGAGARVTLFERAADVGGKVRAASVGDALIDAGPTVFTMRWVFDELFAAAGGDFVDHVELSPADILARHAWTQGGALDLFADIDRSASAIQSFAGARDAENYRDFCRQSREVFETLRGPFIASSRPTPASLARRIGLHRPAALLRTSPFRTLWSHLGRRFIDPRLRQLFARYATYVGSSPLRAPATLMLIAHVEQSGVWLVRGGMRRLARALRDFAEHLGVDVRVDSDVERIIIRDDRVVGLHAATGGAVELDAIVCNVDPSALAAGSFGEAARNAAQPMTRAARSLSAVTWCATARTRGFALDRHNVFFAGDYPAEFETIFARRSVCASPTVYVCAQDRGEAGAAPDGEERLLILINAPADGDQGAFAPEAVAALRARADAVMATCGLTLSVEAETATGPAEFHALFPATGGALYGRANHGPFASFRRPGARTAIDGLYLAGGGAHPGAGVPMAAMSGRLAAAQLRADFGF